jgi:hypothetical protein
MSQQKLWQPETEQWLLKTAWKKMTLQQIALHINVSVSTIMTLYKKHNIEPMRKRDLVASQLLDLRDSGNADKLLKPKELAIMFDCSEPLIKEIIRDYKIDIPIRKYNTPKVIIQQLVTDGKKTKSIEDYDKHIAEVKKRRSSFSVYTQSGSELTDAARGINTTIRPKTYLTNNGI